MPGRGGDDGKAPPSKIPLIARLLHQKHMPECDFGLVLKAVPRGTHVGGGSLRMHLSSVVVITIQCNHFSVIQFVRFWVSILYRTI